MRPVLIPQPGDGGVVPVAPFLKGKIASLYKHLPLAMAGHEEPIHQTRVAARRLRVTIPLSARNPKGKKIVRVLRSLKALSRIAAKSRDLDVIMSLFEGEARPADDSAARRILRRKLMAARTAARRELTESLLDFEVPRLRRDLRAIVSKGNVEGLEVVLRLRLMREEEGQTLIADLERIGTKFEPERLHEARRAIRRMRYAAELSAWIRGGDGGDTKAFREAQDLLGELHDAWVLAQWLGRQAALAGRRGNTEEAQEALWLEASFEDLSRALHIKFLEWDPIANLRRALAQVGRSAAVA